MPSNDNGDGADGADPDLVALARRFREEQRRVRYSEADLERGRIERDARGPRG